jgi:hypothetical protein
MCVRMGVEEGASGVREVDLSCADIFCLLLPWPISPSWCGREGGTRRFDCVSRSYRVMLHGQRVNYRNPVQRQASTEVSIRLSRR